MSWARIRLGSGTLRIKPKYQMRSYEHDRTVPTFDLGFVIISWWSDQSVRKYRHEHGFDAQENKAN